MDSRLLGRSIDAPLDAVGAAQAVALARQLATVGPLRVHCSPRRRTQQTAAPIASIAASTIELASALDEVDFGCWAGMTFARLAEDACWREWNRRRATATTPAGESATSVYRRFSQYLRAQCECFPGETLVIVTHAELIRIAVLTWLGAALDAFWRLDIAPASMTTVRMSGAEVRIEAVNVRVCA